MSYYGDFRPGQVVRGRFNSVNPTTGSPATLASGTVSIVKDGTVVTPSGGVTFAADVDGVVGYNHILIDTSADPATFTVGSEYCARLSAGSVGGVAVAGIVIAEWSIENRAIALDATGKVSLAPTGLDSVATAEPTGRPTTFPGFIVWMFMRFANDSDRTQNTIIVKKTGGATATTQAITDDGAGNETQGAAA